MNLRTLPLALFLPLLLMPVFAGAVRASEEDALDALARELAVAETAREAERGARVELARTSLSEIREEVERDPSYPDLREKRTADVARLTDGFRILTARLVGETAVDDDLRAFLGREDAPAVVFDAWIRNPGRVDALQAVLDHTRLGRALVRGEGGAWSVNRHAAWDLDDLLLTLRRRAEDRAALMETDDDAEVVRRALEKARDAEVAAAAPSAEEVRARVAATRDELAAEGATTVLALGDLAYDAAGLDLFRSSIFYNPRTRAGGWYYASEFDDHFAARLFGLWGWNAKVAKDEAELVDRLRKQQANLRYLAKTHDKIIVHISGVPPWLSSSDDEGSFEGGGWANKQTHMPRDLEVWKRLIAELATVFRGVEGVERYYEFWNEPDLKYWQGSIEEFLELYAVTARTIREVDPEGKIGGCAPNQWDGKVHKKTGSDLLNLELIRYAKKHDLPLDFVSWHHFGRPVAAIGIARARYLAEWRSVGFEGEPEWLVTEWSSPARGTPYANIPFAELLLAFREAGVDVQTASCWEEFHAKPDPKGFAPWGLMTQQGHRKNRWYVHRFFDQVARGSVGVAVVRDSERRTVVVSKRAGGEYDVLVWEKGTTPRLKAAWDVLEGHGFDRKTAARAFAIGDRMERAIAAGEAPAEKWAEAFAAATDVYAAYPVQTTRFLLEISDAAQVEILACEAVRMSFEAKRPAATVENRVAVALAPQEVLRLRLRIR